MISEGRKESQLNKKHAKILRGPLEVQFDITNKCNFRCLHCYNASGENCLVSDELTDDEVIQLFNDIKKLKPFNICFCGGETLLRKDLIVTVSKLVKDEVDNLSIVTNGYLLSEAILDELIDAGINRIQISLDGYKRETHERLRQKEFSYEKAINAIKLCLSKKDKLTDFMISFVPTSFNICEFSDMAEFLYELGVQSIRVQPLMAMGRGNDNSRQLLPSNYQYRLLLKQIEQLKSKYGQNFVAWGDPIDHIIRFSHYFTEISTAMTIKANGSLSVTPYFPISIGNIRKHSAIDYWNKGLPAVWGLDIIQRISKYYRCIDDLGKEIIDFPVVFKEKDFYYDIIDNNMEEKYE